MNWRIAVGMALVVIGAGILPFGWWVARIYFYAGLFLAGLGAGVALSAYRNLKLEIYDRPSPNEPDIPIIGEARGFKGREILERSHVSDGDDARDA